MELLKVYKKCPKMPKMQPVKKCCFCIPIRKGVLIFGYISLVISLIALPVTVFFLVEHLTTGAGFTLPNMDPLVHLPMTICFIIMDLVMSIVLLIGAHKKRRLLLQIYFYFNVVFQLVMVTVDLVFFVESNPLENFLYFLFICCNIYLLFLVYNLVSLTKASADVEYVVYENQAQA